jgi:two-component system sensor histidine kinase UhpB
VCVLVAACVLLWIQPANGRLIVLLGGLTVMVVVNVLLLRRAFAPLTALTATMRSVDPLRPGHRIHVLGPETEVAILGDAFNEMLDRIETERRDSALRALRAQEAERRRLTAELHDELGQCLTALSFELGHVSSRIPQAEDDLLAEARSMARAALADVHRIVRGLRPEALDDLGLIPALTNLCDRASVGGGPTVRRGFAPALPVLSAEAELVLYRVAQESLTNVVRHAHATTARVSLRPRAGGVELEVRDDGQGIPDPAPAGGQGIRGMRERALAVGAELTIERPRGGGTRIRLRMPGAGR